MSLSVRVRARVLGLRGFSVAGVQDEGLGVKDFGLASGFAPAAW